MNMQWRCYTAVIGDIVQSRALKRRDVAQRAFLGAIEHLNEALEDDIAAKAIVLRGDDFQLLLQSPDRLPEVIWIMSALRPVEVRFGVGIGELKTPLQEYAIGADGPAWHEARKAIEAAHKLKSSPIVVRGLSERDEGPGNALLRSYYHLVAQMTAKQRELVELARTGAKQQYIAERLGISQPTVATGLQKAEYELQTFVAGAAKQLLGRYTLLPSELSDENAPYTLAIRRPSPMSIAAEQRAEYQVHPDPQPRSKPS